MGGSHPSLALSLPLSSPSRHQPARCSIYTGHFLWEQYCPGGRLGLEGGRRGDSRAAYPGTGAPEEGQGGAAAGRPGLEKGVGWYLHTGSEPRGSPSL